MAKNKKGENIPARLRAAKNVEDLNIIALELAEQLMQDSEPSEAAHLLSEQARLEKVRNEIRTSLQTLYNRLESGTRVIITMLQEMAQTNTEMNYNALLTDIKKIGAFFDNMPGREDEYRKQFIANMTIQEMCAISDATIEALYQAAKCIYEKQHYEEAVDAFTFLTTINGKKYVFWLALGNSEYFCQNYEAALQAYRVGGELNPADPTYPLYAAACYEAMSDFDNALGALENTLNIIDYTKGDPALRHEVIAKREKIKNMKRRTK